MNPKYRTLLRAFVLGALTIVVMGAKHQVRIPGPGGESVSTAQSAILVQLSAGDNTYTTAGEDGSSHTTSMTNALPNGTTSGNSLLAVLVGQDNSGTITMSDNAGSNTWSLDCSQDYPTYSREMWVYRVASATAGTRVVTASFATGKQNVVMNLYEYQHLGSLDGSCVSAATTGGTISAGSKTPGASGDYLFQAAVNVVDDTITHFAQSTQSNWAVQMLTSDTVTGNSTNAFENALATQGGVYSSTSAINPQMTQTGGSTNGYISVALAYSKGSTGGPAPSTNYIVGIHHYLMNIGQNASYSTYTIDYPCQGTNVMAQYNGGGSSTTSYDHIDIKDSNGNWWPEVGTEQPTADGNQTRELYYLGMTCSGSTTMTWKVTENFAPNAQTLVSAINYIIYDFNGSWGIDNAGYTSGTQASSGNVNGVSITPAASNELFFDGFVNDKGYPNGFSGAGVFDSVIYGNMNYTTGQNVYADELSGHGHYFNTGSSAYQPVWTTGSTQAYNQWSSVTSAFGAAPTSMNKTFSVVQSVSNGSCSGSTTCAVTLSSTGAGHVLIALAYNNSGGSRMLGASAGCAVPWEFLPGVQALDTNDRNSTGMICLKSVSGVTSITLTAENNSGGAPSGYGASIAEISCTANCGNGLFAVDAMNGQNDAACTSCSVASMGTLRGSSDIICYEFNTPSGITAPGSPYTSANQLGVMGSVCAINTTTQLSSVSQGSSATIAEGGVAIY